MHSDILWKQLKTKQKNHSTHRPGGFFPRNIPEPLLNRKVYVIKFQLLAWRPQNCSTDYFMKRVMGTMCERVVTQHIHAYGFPLCHLRLCEHEDLEQERQ